MKRISIVLFAVTALAACSKDKSGGGGGGGGAPAAVALPKVGLSIDVPGKVEVGDAIMGEGHMLQGSGIGALSVEVQKEAAQLETEKKEIDMYSPKNVKAETLPDGWALTFENKGGMGTNYFVDVRRTIDGKHYKCSTTGGDAGQAAAVLAACKTLRKG